MLGLERQIEELNSRISNLFRVGTITSLLPADMKARVVFEDRDNMESYDLLVIVKNTMNNKDYWMPDIGETVLCCFLPIGLEQGFIIGGYYPQPVSRPANTENVRKVKFADGTVIEYDRESHQLLVDVPADGATVVVNAQTKVTVNSPLIDLGEAADLEPSVLGDKLATWITSQLKPWLDNHNHPAGTPFTGSASSGTQGAFNAGNGAQGGNVYSQKNKNQ